MENKNSKNNICEETTNLRKNKTKNRQINILNDNELSNKKVKYNQIKREYENGQFSVENNLYIDDCIKENEKENAYVGNINWKNVNKSLACYENKNRKTLYRHNVINEEQKSIELLLSRSKSIEHLETINFDDLIKNNFFNSLHQKTTINNKNGKGKEEKKISNSIEVERNNLADILYKIKKEQEEEHGEQQNKVEENEEEEEEEEDDDEEEEEEEEEDDEDERREQEEENVEEEDDEEREHEYERQKKEKDKEEEYEEEDREEQDEEEQNGELEEEKEEDQSEEEQNKERNRQLINEDKHKEKEERTKEGHGKNKDIMKLKGRREEIFFYRNSVISNEEKNKNEQNEYPNIVDICKSYIKNFNNVNKSIFKNKNESKFSKKKNKFNLNVKNNINNSEDVHKIQKGINVSFISDEMKKKKYCCNKNKYNPDNNIISYNTQKKNVSIHSSHMINESKQNEENIKKTKCNCNVNKSSDNIIFSNDYESGRYNEISSLHIRNNKKRSNKNVKSFLSNIVCNNNNSENKPSLDIINHCKNSNLNGKSDINDVMKCFSDNITSNCNMQNFNLKKNISPQMILEYINSFNSNNCNSNDEINKNNLTNHNIYSYNLNNDKGNNFNTNYKNINNKVITSNSTHKNNILRTNKDNENEAIFTSNNNAFNTNIDINLDKKELTSNSLISLINGVGTKNLGPINDINKMNILNESNPINSFHMRNNNKVSEKTHCLKNKKTYFTNKNDEYIEENENENEQKIILNSYYDDVIKCYRNYTINGYNDEKHFYFCEYCEQNIFNLNNILRENVAKEYIYTCNISCGKTFHKKCVSYIKRDDNYICFFCLNDISFCSLCRDITTNDKLLPCYYPLCNISFHLNCIENLNLLKTDCLKQYAHVSCNIITQEKKDENNKFEEQNFMKNNNCEQKEINVSNKDDITIKMSNKNNSYGNTIDGNTTIKSQINHSLKDNHSDNCHMKKNLLNSSNFNMQSNNNNEHFHSNLKLNRYICPLHVCYVCKDFYIINLEKIKNRLNNCLFRCIKCFKSIHLYCMSNNYIISYKQRVMYCSSHIEYYKKKHMESLNALRKNSDNKNLVKKNRFKNELQENNMYPSMELENNSNLSTMYNPTITNFIINNKTAIENEKIKRRNALFNDEEWMATEYLNKSKTCNLKKDINNYQFKEKMEIYYENANYNNINRKIMFDLIAGEEKLDILKEIQNKINVDDNFYKTDYNNLLENDNYRSNFITRNHTNVDDNFYANINEEKNLNNTNLRNLSKICLDRINRNNLNKINENYGSSFNEDNVNNNNNLNVGDINYIEKKRKFSNFNELDILKNYNLDINILSDFTRNKSDSVSSQKVNNIMKSDQDINEGINFESDLENNVIDNELYDSYTNNLTDNFDKNNKHNNNTNENINNKNEKIIEFFDNFIINNDINIKNQKNNDNYKNENISKDKYLNLSYDTHLNEKMKKNMEHKYITTKIKKILDIEKALLSLNEINVDQINEECEKQINTLCSLREDFINYVIFLFNKKNENEKSNNISNHNLTKIDIINDRNINNFQNTKDVLSEEKLNKNVSYNLNNNININSSDINRDDEYKRNYVSNNAHSITHNELNNSSTINTEKRNIQSTEGNNMNDIKKGAISHINDKEDKYNEVMKEANKKITNSINIKNKQETIIKGVNKIDESGNVDQNKKINEDGTCEKKDETFNNYDENGNEEDDSTKGKKKCLKNCKIDMNDFFSTTKNGYKIDVNTLKKYSHYLNFEYISKNVYLNDQHKNLLSCKSDDYRCLCQGECDPFTCYNSLSKIQCSKNRCNLPIEIQDRKCFNRPFKHSAIKDLEIKKTEKTGYGVFCKRDIKNGELICEYVGEVLGKKDFEKRMEIYKEESKKTEMYNWYSIQINRDVHVDSRKKGSISRFVNHSCSPNSVSQKWIVRGYYRIGIFALQDIPCGEEITYNYSYNFVFNNFECLCNSPNCMNYNLKRKNESDNEISDNEIKNNDIFNPIDNFNNLHKKLQDWNISTDNTATKGLYQYNKLNATNLRLMECYSTWVFYDLDFHPNHYFSLKSKPFNVSAEFWKILVSSFSDGEKNIINSFSLFLPSLIKIGQLRRIQQYSYILHNIVGAEHEMWNLIDKGFADDEVCRKCKSCGNLTMCDKCFNSYHYRCGNMHSKVYKNNELVLCKFCQKYDYKLKWIKQNHREKMKNCIEIRSNAFYKINRDIISLLEQSVKYTENQTIQSINEHNSKACNSKKLKLKKFQYKYVKL